jgi:hypothetical protein
MFEGHGFREGKELKEHGFVKIELLNGMPKTIRQL